MSKSKSKATSKGKSSIEEKLVIEEKTVSKATSKGKSSIEEKLVIEEKTVISIEKDLTDQELVDLSRELIKETDILETIREDIKAKQIEFKGKISEREQKIKELQTMIKSGKKDIVVTAGKIRDFNKTEVLYVNPDADLENLKDSDIYKTEPFTAFDYQHTLMVDTDVIEEVF